MIRTHDPSVRACEDSSILRPRGHCERPRNHELETEISPDDFSLPVDGIYFKMFKECVMAQRYTEGSMPFHTL
jgi:hypothetical protein